MCLAITRSSVPSVSGFVSRSRSRPRRSWRGASPSPNGGASREGSGTGETIENAQGRPERSAAAAAPQAPSSTKRTSGRSASIACSRSRELEGSALAELAETLAQRAEARSRPPVVGLEPLDLGPERMHIETERAQALDIVDSAAHRHVMTSIRQLEQRRDQRIQPAGHRIDIRQDDSHRQPSPTPLRGRAHALTRGRAARSALEQLEDPLRVRPDRADVPEHPLAAARSRASARSSSRSRSRRSRARHAGHTAHAPSAAAPTSNEPFHLTPPSIASGATSPTARTRPAETRLDSNS